VCVCVYTELGIALVPYSPLGRGFFAGYKPGAENQDSRNVCNLSSSNAINWVCAFQLIYFKELL
jgi:aryl-alcohol dehydrogenase-like predicted oxidoreductase